LEGRYSRGRLEISGEGFSTNGCSKALSVPSPYTLGMTLNVSFFGMYGILGWQYQDEFIHSILAFK